MNPPFTPLRPQRGRRRVRRLARSCRCSRRGRGVGRVRVHELVELRGRVERCRLGEHTGRRRHHDDVRSGEWWSRDRLGKASAIRGHSHQDHSDPVAHVASADRQVAGHAGHGRPRKRRHSEGSEAVGGRCALELFPDQLRPRQHRVVQRRHRLGADQAPGLRRRSRPSPHLAGASKGAVGQGEMGHHCGLPCDREATDHRRVEWMRERCGDGPSARLLLRVGLGRQGQCDHRACARLPRPYRLHRRVHVDRQVAVSRRARPSS